MSMRKALVVLGMVAFASVSFAKAPVISGIPDIVIGDNEDQSATYDNNWFRYQNAFNLLSYTKDVDSAAGNVFFTFLEETTANDLNITIDAVSPNVNKSQVPVADALDPGAWGTHEITNYGQATRDYLLTFVDMVRSNPANQTGNGVTGAMFANPRRADGTEVLDGVTEDLPWHNNQSNLTQLTGSSRSVQIFAADDPTATEVGSDIMTVISRNYANDALSGGLTTQYSANFASGAGTLWTYEGASGLGVCTSGQGTASPNGYISIQSPGPLGAGGINYGRWYTARQGFQFFEGQIPYVANVVYAARYLLSHNVDTSVTRKAVPQLRLGVNQVRFTIIVRQLVGAVNGDAKDLNPQIPDQGDLVMYKVPFSMNEGSPNFSSLLIPANPPTNPQVDLRTYDAYFDVLDESATQGGTWTLHNFDVVTFPRPADLATPTDAYGVGQATGFTTAAGWTVGLNQASGGRAITLTQNGDGSLRVNDPGAPTGTSVAAGNYYMWEKVLDSAKVKWEGGTMIRTKFAMSVPAAADRSNFHTFRLRLRPAIALWWDTEWIMTGDNNADNGFLPLDTYTPPLASAGPFTYEAYTSSQVVDDALLATIHSSNLNGIGYDRLLLGMDFIHGINAAAANPTYDDAIGYTMHSLTLEVLDETL